MIARAGWSVRRAATVQLILCAALYSLHDVTAVLRAHAPYSAFGSGVDAPSLILDEAVYAAAASRYESSGQVFSELDVFEAREQNNGYTTVFAAPIGLIARVIGLDATWVIIHTLAPAIIWLIAFLVLHLFLRDVVSASAIAWLTCLFAPAPRNALLIGNGGLVQPLELMRTYNPSISLPLLLLALVAFARAIHGARHIWIVVAGVAIGLQPYFYYYYGIAAAGTPVIAAAVLFAMRQRAAARNALLAGAVAVVVMTPYLYGALSAQEGMQHHLARVGGFTHAPDAIGLAVALLAMAAAAALLRAHAPQPVDRNTALALTVLCVIAAAGLGMNAQVLTGYNAQHRSHFLNRLIQPLAFASLMCWLTVLIRRREPRLPVRSLLAGAAIVIAALGLVRQISAGTKHAERIDADAERYDVLRWIRAHGGAAVVIGTTDAQIISLAPAVSAAWNFIPHYRRSLVSEEEAALRYLAMLALEGTSLPQARHRAAAARSGATDDRLSERVMLKLVDGTGRAHELSRSDLDVVMRTRKLDYLIMATSVAALPRSGSWRRVYSTPGYTVFEASPSAAVKESSYAPPAASPPRAASPDSRRSRT